MKIIIQITFKDNGMQHATLVYTCSSRFSLLLKIYVAVPRKQLKTPQKNHLVVFHQKYFFKSRLAFILYKKVFEYTAMHLAT